MLHRHGFTLMEILIVMIIIAVCVAVSLPSFTGPNELALSSVAKNNLLAIYSAERNYNNNNGAFISLSPTPGTDPNGVGAINSQFSLNIQDDGSYSYLCNTTDASGFACIATRNDSSFGDFTITVTNTPIQLIQSKSNPNPNCAPPPNGNVNWCP